MAIYMKYGKPDVKGAVTKGTYKDWIELDSIDFAFSRPVPMQSGGGTHRRHRGTATPSSLSCTHTLDNASLGLMKAALGVSSEVPVEIHCCKHGKEGPDPYMKIKLTEVMCTDFSMQGGGSAGISDSFELDWWTLDIEYTAFDEKGGVKPARVTYSFADAGGE